MRRRLPPPVIAQDQQRVMPMPIAVRIPQAVAMLGVSRSKLYQFIQSGEIEIVKLGRSTVVPVDSLARFIERRRKPIER